MAVTIKQIAEHTGLSLQTVSQILNDKSEAYRPETRERVLQSAQELGYRPNSSARAMRNGQFGCLALLLSTVQYNSLLPPALLDGIQDGCEAANVSLSIARLPDEKLVSPDVMPKILREWTVDGLLIDYNAGIPEEMIALIEKHHLPVIWINSKQTADCVYPDDRAGTRLGTEYLLERGHTRIAYVDWLNAGHYSNLERVAGYTEAMERAGITPRVIRERCEVSTFETVRATTKWLVDADRPTAVLCYNNSVALPLVYAAGVQGIVLPSELSLLTINDDPHTALTHDLDTLLLPQREMGRRAVELLMQKIAAPTVPLAPCPLPLKLHSAGSCAAPPLHLSA